MDQVYDNEVNVFCRRFNRFSDKAQVRRATLSCDSSYYFHLMAHLFSTTGVVYITYSKTSEAAHALEEMNGRVIKGNPKPMKVCRYMYLRWLHHYTKKFSIHRGWKAFVSQCSASL